MLTNEVKNNIERSVLCWLATVDQNGCPNVSPKEVFAADGESRMLIANIASPESVRNIQFNANVCVSFIDVFIQKGFKLRGRAIVIAKSDPRFGPMATPLIAITKGTFPIHSIIEIQVTDVAQILAPSYRLIPGATEEAQIKSAMATYGVCQRPSDT